MDFGSYERLVFERRPNGVLLITINRPEKHNAADRQMLAEFTRVWKDVAEDAETRAVVITGSGRAFSAGGDLSEEVEKLNDFPSVVKTLEEARGLVANMVECDNR